MSKEAKVEKAEKVHTPFDLSKVESDGMVDPAELTVITDKTHPLYDDRVLLPWDDDIVKGIMRYGVRDAVECVRDGKALVIVDGRQRRTNTIEANRRLLELGKPIVKVRVRIVRFNANDSQDLLNLKNEHRQSDSLMIRARKMQQMIDHGKSKEEVRMIFRINNVTTLNRHLSLNSLCTEAATAFERGDINAVTAYELAPLSYEEQMKALGAAKPGTGESENGGNTTVPLSTKQVRAAARASQGKTAGIVPGKRELAGALGIVNSMWKISKDIKRKNDLALVGHVLEYVTTGEKHPDLEDLLKLVAG